MEIPGYLVRGPLALVLQISRIHGVAPLRLEPRNNEYYAQNSSFMTHYSRFILIILSKKASFLIKITDILTLIGLVLDLFDVRTKKAIRVNTISSLVVWLIDVTSILIITGLGVFQGPYRMTRIMEHLKNIDKVKLKLKKIKAPRKQKLSVTIIFIMIGMYILMAGDIGYYVMDAMTHGKSMIVVHLYGSQYIKYSMAFFLHMQIALVILSAKSAFKTINDRLRELIQLLDLKCSHKLTSIEFLSAENSLREIADCYVTICNIIKDINEDNGILLIAMYMSSITYLVVSNYYLIAALCSPIGFMRNFNIILQFIWCVYHSFKILLLIEPCHRTHEQMEETRVLASQLTYRMTPSGEPLPAELDTFHKQLILYNPSFSPLNICTLNRSQIAGIIAGVTTYLLIIVQQRLIDECT
nr:gustatory receptor 4 [Papilio polytes]